MIKGCQKKMIVLRNVDGKYFTEAFFVLREDCVADVSHADMVAEANRIVEESLGGIVRQTSRKKRTSPRAAAFFYFLLGALAAGALSLLFFFVFR